MAWAIELSAVAEKTLARLDRPAAKRLDAFLSERLTKLANPRSIGEALRGELGDFWKYRVGDFRIIAAIEDRRLVILVVRIGNRRDVYKR